MSNMFTNYDNPTNIISCDISQVEKPEVMPIFDIKKRFLGVQVDQGRPFTLYFHLENFNSCETAEASSRLISGITKLEILSLTGKSVAKQEYVTVEVLDCTTHDISLVVPQTIVDILKKETYVLRIDLEAEDICCRVFSEKDGYLVVR